jgi:hypothetical protein
LQGKAEFMHPVALSGLPPRGATGVGNERVQDFLYKMPAMPVFRDLCTVRENRIVFQ